MELKLISLAYARQKGAVNSQIKLIRDSVRINNQYTLSLPEGITGIINRLRIEIREFTWCGGGAHPRALSLSVVTGLHCVL